MKFIGKDNNLEYLISPFKKNILLLSLSIIGIFIGTLNIFLGPLIDITKLTIFSCIWFLISYLEIFINKDDISLFFKVRFF